MKRFIFIAAISFYACKSNQETVKPFYDAKMIDSVVKIYMTQHLEDAISIDSVFFRVDSLTNRSVGKDQALYEKGQLDFVKNATRDEMITFGYNPSDSKSDSAFLEKLYKEDDAKADTMDNRKPFGFKVLGECQYTKKDMTLSGKKYFHFYMNFNYKILNKMDYIDISTIPTYPFSEWFYFD